MVIATQPPPLALYIHWPFCVSKCPYCDFNSHVRTTVDEELWLKSLLGDMQYERSMLPDHQLCSIFFGGGTPSLMPAKTVAALIEAATRLWPTAENLEITLEANPSSVESGKFADLSRAGINRVSLGIQSLDHYELSFLGRAHNVNEARHALASAQRHFSRVNADFIYALPEHTPVLWHHKLNNIIALGTDHLSLYQLTIEPGTRFETDFRRKQFTLPSEEDAADMFLQTREATTAAGLPAYEVSNHARVGSESRHNLAYWQYQDYAGIGPGAHGRRQGLATMRHKKPENWLSAVSRNGHGMVEETPLSQQERAKEALVMGLRLTNGVNLARIQTATGIDTVIDDRKVVTLQNQGLILRSSDSIALTEAGFPLLDAILAEIVIL
jgi:putative oxygen-independent coproporphyrinogen III oxidase